MQICSFIALWLLRLWTVVLKMFGGSWVLPPTVDYFLSTFIKGDGVRKVAKPLWYGIVFAGLWSIWLERNSIIFNNRNPLCYALWGGAIFSAIVWAKVHDHFSDISVTDCYHCWDILIQDM